MYHGKAYDSKDEGNIETYNLSTYFASRDFTQEAHRQVKDENLNLKKLYKDSQDLEI